MRTLLVLSVLALTACGADSPPLPPTRDAAITITGDVTIGARTRID